MKLKPYKSLFSEMDSKIVAYPSLQYILEDYFGPDFPNAYKAALKARSSKILDIIEDALKKNYNFFKENGIPYPGDDKHYDELIETNNGIRLFQKLVDRLHDLCEEQE